ncbi:reverse transcriptase-like protein [Citricoccus sp. NR2]|uniref:reverse transcriptase-like protein n=1 Tax=Citricoccus sp. NR2 TaxID=3004095 RepID=UPI0022DE4604|nr:reverse transcriptase-like protein [Citricoccus sp. NR2]WBL18458.1 reverse transcriptase-like protein [Citricoccus sp. NR2]
MNPPTDAATAPTHLIVEADGGSRGNPGVAGYGALVRDPNSGELLAIDAAPLGIASNNVAEYSGLIAGLTMARDLNPNAMVRARLDSKLVVEQMTGRWKIKNADMKRLAMEAHAVLPAHQVSYDWIPREKNKDADLLSNEAMDAGAAGTAWVEADSALSVASSPNTPDTTASAPAAPPRRLGRLHHVEIWVPDLARARDTLGWLLTELGYEISGEWSEGTSYQGAGEYIVLEHGSDVTEVAHERRRPGMNHLAFYAGPREAVDALTEDAVQRGFTLMFPDRHPYAGGRRHYAAYLESPDGFEVELVAD